MSDSDSDSDEIMKPPERREPSARGNRGSRMQKLIAEEEDEMEEQADKEFYQQGFWEDEEADNDFNDADDEDGVDSFDSDFGDSSESGSDSDDDDEKGAKKKAKPKKKSVYKDPKLAHKKGEGPGAGEAGSSSAAPAPKPSHKKRPRPAAAEGFDQPLERSRRGSTLASSADAVAKRKSLDAAAKERAEKLAAAGGRGKQVELRRLTQEDLLAEAAQTEIMNKASLERMLRMEEEKRRVVKTSRVLDGPRIRYTSKRDGEKVINTVSFIQTPVPPNIDGIAPPYPVASRCSVSGAPAKYFDPQTNTPYATLEAFRMLRGRTGRRQHSFGGGTAMAAAEE